MPYSAADVRAREFLLRMLLVGPAKAGKTCTAVLTSPQPVMVLNSDGQGGLDGSALLGGNFTGEDIVGYATAKNALAYVKARSKEFSTVIFDNITSFSLRVEQEVRKEIDRDDPRVIYPEIKRRLMHIVQLMLDLPQHVIMIGHAEVGESGVSGTFGHMLALSGGSKTLIPMQFQDWVWLEITLDPKTQQVNREFLLAPSGNWSKGCRSIVNASRMDANIGKFIELASDRADARVAKKPVVQKPPTQQRPVPVRAPNNHRPVPVPVK